MTHDRTYRPFRCVSAPRLQGADGSMRQAPRRSAGYAATHPVQPLKGLPGTRATDISYRALAPGGAGFCYQICTGTSESRPTAHYSLLTAHSTYTFSAKERDSETGLSYFGSRYYSSDLSIWLSVDPMSDKYASLSPYTYCADNPVKLVDPDGEEIYVGDNYYYQNGSLYYKGTTDVYVPTKGSFEEKALIALNTLRGTKQGWELMSPFEGETNKTDKKDKDIIIKEASKNPNTPGKVEVNDYNYSSDNDFLAATIYWNPEG